jgi:xanthine dehydrogenase accessory factor
VKASLIARAVAAASAGTPVVLVRALGDNERWLVTPREGVEGSTLEMPAALLEQARAALARDGAAQTELDGKRYLLQTLGPAARLIVVGAVHIAQKLIPLAQIAGFDVVLIDPRAAFATAERFPGVKILNDWPQEAMPALALNSRTALVTLSHDAKIDEPALGAALSSEAFYIGALGSKGNHAKRLVRLRERGFDERSLARIAAPVGLPLGGRSPAEIAVAILAQMIQSRYRSAAA